ncbi:MAG TPA: glycerophosphodiester phosphodiesterase [Solirubrobacteraceae bacterium]|nr:glycerophosphodiester phosphodiesterase [Solirubrobacteraceae bacterium]
MPMLIAHRGSHRSEPENTLAAFSAAVRDGADMVEFDVRRTRDGELVIFHDPEVARRAVPSLTHAELCELSATPVPRLADVLAWARDVGVGCDVELKEDGYVAEVAELLSEAGGPLLVSSFLDPVLAQLAQLAPELERGLLLSFTARGAVDRVRACGAGAAIIAMKLLEEAPVRELHAAGLGVLVWDFLPGRPGHAAWLTDPRIQAVITDDVPGTRALTA